MIYDITKTPQTEVPKNPQRALHLSGSEARFGGGG